jgi:filamentous hemagglutinin family protein
MMLQTTSLCFSRQRLLATALAMAFSAPTGLALALPNDAQVVAGMAQINRQGAQLTVNNSHNAIINWQSFNIAAGETVRFNQPAASSSVLNRVLGADPSQLLGRLDSNGRVWLVNPAGILVGPGARIDTAGFVASALPIRNEDFLAGRLNFQSSSAAGSVVNQGVISAASGGSVYLVGKEVSNQGVIRTPQGETLLAAGQTVELIDTATPGVKVEITGATGQATNLGQVVAEAGRIGMVGVLVKNSGQLDASSVVREGGRIFLKAVHEARVEGNGQLMATGVRGGQAEVLGEQVVLTDQARLDASGQQGGGTLLVGGDARGQNVSVKNAYATWFGPQASIVADATQEGDGGKVIVWADEVTRAHGSVSAQGAAGGRGGFVETSAHYLKTDGIRLKLGTGGEWLLDPYNVTIMGGTDISVTGSPNFTPLASGATVAPATINALLNAGTSVTVDTTGGGAEAGDITLNTAAIQKTAGSDATLTLKAHNDINLAQGQINSTAGKLNVVLQADQAGGGSTGLINLDSLSSIGTNGGDVTASSRLVTLDGTINAGAGKVAFQTSQTNRPVDLGTKSPGVLGFTAAELNQITASELKIGSTTAGNLAISASIAPTNASTLRLESGGTVSQSAGVTVTNLAVRSLGSVTLNGSNLVSNLAAQIGDASNLNKSFTFNNGTGNLSVGNVAGLSGISIQTSGVYNSGAPDGVIALKTYTFNEITQVAGALLAGKAVYAEGRSVTLANANPTGVIAGKALGAGLTDKFEYASSSGVQLSTVNSFAGVQTTGTAATTGIILSAGAAGISQDAGAPIDAGNGATGLSVATSGPVSLDASSSNKVSAVATSGSVGQLKFKNNVALATGSIATTGGPVTIDAASALTVKGNLSAGAGTVTLTASDVQLGTATPVTISGANVTLRASTASTGSITTVAGGGATVTASNGIAIRADNLGFAVAPTFNGSSEISYRTVSDNRTLTYGSTCNSSPCLLVNNVTNTTANLFLGHNVAADTDTTGDLHVGAALTNSSGRIVLLSGGNVTQGAAITATDLGVGAGGSATLDSGNSVTNLAAQVGGGISLTNNPSLNVVSMTAGSLTVNGIAAGGPVVLQTTGAAANLTLNAQISSASSTSNAVVLSSKYGFSKTSGGITLTGTGSPRWLVYANDPASVTKGGLTSNFRHYGKTYGTYPSPIESGNGFIYASTPGTLVVDTSLSSGAASHVFGAAPTAVFGYSYANAGIADNEDLALVSGPASFTPTVNSSTAAGSYLVQYASGLSSAAGYSFSTGAGLAYTVDPAPLTVVTAALTGSTSKVYDGTTQATLTPENYNLSGFVGTDNATVTQKSGSYASKNVGSNLRVTATLASSDFQPQGTTNLANYTLPTKAVGDIGSITPAGLTLTGLSADDKVYDATTQTPLNVSQAQLAGVLAGDVITLKSGSGSFADKHVGKNKIVTATAYQFEGADAGNYQVASVNPLAASITPATLTISGLVASDKVYDATTRAVVDQTAGQLAGVMPGDELDLAPCTGNFDDKQVGLAKQVKLDNPQLAGVDAGNYVIGEINPMQANVSPAQIVRVTGIRALDKDFDGRTRAELDFSQARLMGRLEGDDLVVTDASGHFEDALPGAGKRVDINGITLGGSDAGNYTLMDNEAVTLARIRRPGAGSLDDLPASDRVDRIIEIAGNRVAQDDRVGITGNVLPPAVILNSAMRNAPMRAAVVGTIGGRAGEFGGPLRAAAERRQDARAERRDDADGSAQDHADDPASTRSRTQRPAQRRLPLCS